MVGRASDAFDALWEEKGTKYVPLTFPPCIIFGISDMVYLLKKTVADNGLLNAIYCRYPVQNSSIKKVVTI